MREDKGLSIWPTRPLGEPSLADIAAGGTPRRSVPRYFKGPIPWAKIGDLTRAGKYIADTEEKVSEEAIENSNARVFPSGTVLVSMYGSIGRASITLVPMATNQAILGIQPNPAALSGEYLYYFLLSAQPRLETLGRGATQDNINASHVKALRIPLPSLPVQGRVVLILQKADEIRHKRHEALDLADSILPAALIAMFGDPTNDRSDVERVPLGQLANVRSGVTKGRKLHGKEVVEVPYLRVANVQDGFLDLSEVKTIEVLPDDIDKYHLEDGDILMTEGGDPDKLGRGSVWRNQIEGSIHQNHVFRVRADRGRLTPEYLAALLRTQYARHYFLGCAKRTSNLASVNSTQVKAFPVPLPSIYLQEKFVSAVEQWILASEKLTRGLKDAGCLLASLMDAAFSGELTAEWEAANADWIAEQVTFHERQASG